jgi:hypothetical protein
LSLPVHLKYGCQGDPQSFDDLSLPQVAAAMVQGDRVKPGFEGFLFEEWTSLMRPMGLTCEGFESFTGL